METEVQIHHIGEHWPRPRQYYERNSETCFSTALVVFKGGWGFLRRVESRTISVDSVCLPACMAAERWVCVANNFISGNQGYWKISESQRRRQDQNKLSDPEWKLQKANIYIYTWTLVLWLDRPVFMNLWWHFMVVLWLRPLNLSPLASLSLSVQFGYVWNVNISKGFTPEDCEVKVLGLRMVMFRAKVWLLLINRLCVSSNWRILNLLSLVSLSPDVLVGRYRTLLLQ